jgi:hypothetical protein
MHCKNCIYSKFLNSIDEMPDYGTCSKLVPTIGTNDDTQTSQLGLVQPLAFHFTTWEAGHIPAEFRVHVNFGCLEFYAKHDAVD